jgi:hypothetical protein
MSAFCGGTFKYLHYLFIKNTVKIGFTWFENVHVSGYLKAFIKGSYSVPVVGRSRSYWSEVWCGCIHRLWSSGQYCCGHCGHWTAVHWVPEEKWHWESHIHCSGETRTFAGEVQNTNQPVIMIYYKYRSICSLKISFHKVCRTILFLTVKYGICWKMISSGSNGEHGVVDEAVNDDEYYSIFHFLLFYNSWNINSPFFLPSFILFFIWRICVMNACVCITCLLLKFKCGNFSHLM